MAWRSWDRPRTGTIFRLPDDMHLQRGITFTILPDGRSLRVPSMSRMQVRAESQGHEENADHDVMQALTDILQGKKPVAGRARHNRRGQAVGNRREQDGIRAGREGLRPVQAPDVGARPGAPYVAEA